MPRLAALLVVLPLLVVLAACGSGGDDAAPSNETVPDATTSQANPTDRPEGERVGDDEDVTSVPPAVDLASYHGEYGPPDDPETRRTWWIATEPCEGEALQLGAMWGDVAPWSLTPESDTVFTGTTMTGNEIRAEFGPANEEPRTLHLTMGEDAWDLVRFGDLPEDFLLQCQFG